MKPNLKRKKIGMFLFSCVVFYIFSWITHIYIWYLIIPMGFLFIINQIMRKKSTTERKDRKNRFQSFTKSSQGDYYDWLVSD